MRLAIVFADNVLYDGTHYYTADYRHYQFSEIARHFESTDLVVFTRRCRPDEANGLETMDVSSMNVVGLPGYYDSKRLLTRSGWEIRVAILPYLLFSVARLFLQRKSDWDVVLLFDPYFTNLFLSLLLLVTRKPAVFFVGARWDRNVRLNARHESLDRRFANYIKSWIYRSTIPALVKRLPTVVTGEDLYEHYNRPGARLQRIAATAVRRVDIDRQVVEARSARSTVPKLAAVCRITLEKGLEYLIQALGILKRREVEVHLTIAGPVVSQRYFQVLLQEVRKAGVEDWVRFAGAVNGRQRILQLYADSDIFVLPSISEGSPKVIPEAMAKGLPVVATRVGGIPGLIKDGVNGLLVPPGDPTELANAIERLVLDPTLRRLLGEGSLAQAENYSLESQMGKFADFIAASCRPGV